MIRSKGWLICGLLLWCMFMAACNEASQQPQAITDLLATETPAESVAFPSQPSQTVPPTSTAQPTRTHTPTPTHTSEPTASPTPTDLPPSLTPTPTETPTPTAVPTREVKVVEGEVVYERSIGGEVIRAAVPEQVVEILDAVGLEPGKYQDVDKAIVWVDDDAVYLGSNQESEDKVKVFVKEEGVWKYNESEIGYWTKYVNLGPALEMSAGSFANTLQGELNRTEVFVNEQSGGWKTLSVNGFPDNGTISNIVVMVDDVALMTQMGRVTFKYLSPISANVVEFTAPVYGEISYNNSGGGPISQLIGRVRPGSIQLLPSGVPYEVETLPIQLRGIRMQLHDAVTLKSMILSGGDLPDNTLLPSFYDRQ